MGDRWSAGERALVLDHGRCTACGGAIACGLGPRVSGSRDWLARGLVLEAHAVSDPPTASAIRDLMAAVARRSLLDQHLRAGVLVRVAAAWASEATLLDLVHWALGPGLWRGPSVREEGNYDV